LTKILLTAALATLLELPINLLVGLSNPSTPLQAGLLTVFGLLAKILVACLTIMWVFQIRFLLALLAWVPTLMASGLLALFALFLFRPFVYEAFVSPTNAMAPTMLGNHWRAKCPECGQPNFCSPVDERYAEFESPRMICVNFHVTRPAVGDHRTRSGDRFLVAKFLKPKRWDPVVFQYPHDPSVLYVMRLVGLPGETIHIEEGKVWADGKPLALPTSLSGLEYVSEFPEWHLEIRGSKDRPAKLGSNEYFVLGDFSYQSSDSRFWQDGAPGHPPFAVPESYMRGVVTHIYWPPQRWRVLR
jgi:signal peptidase I